jgi:hypothetical protein
LVEQVDYMRQLTSHIPIAPLRVVYTGSGNWLAAALISDRAAVIEHKLYWAPVRTVAEARYLTAVLNAPSLNEIVRPLMSRGAFGPRDFDKYMWTAPIPEYSSTDPAHQTLVGLAVEAESASAEVPVDGHGFQKIRSLIRAQLATTGIAGRLDHALSAILRKPEGQSGEQRR